MNLPRAACLPLLLVALGSGCETARTSRIRENRELFQALDPFSQKLVREGLFNVGFTADTVTMSLGKPDHIDTHETADGPVETWTYKNFLYASMTHMTLGTRDPSAVRNSTPRVSQRNSTGTGTGAPVPLSPTIAELGGPPLATLHIEMREGRVARATIDP